MINRNPTPKKAVTSAQDDTCDKQSKKLFFFDVDDDGNITDSDFKEPKINSDLFDNISTDRLTTTGQDGLQRFRKPLLYHRQPSQGVILGD